jgi:hypothetical protein
MIGTNHLSPQRFLAAALLVTLAGCGGGGGGGGPSSAAPVIVTASFSGVGANPAAGDTLVLAFSTTITLAAGQLLTDDDLVLSTGDSLGTVTVAPTLLSSNTLSVTLGAGVSFTPGSSTIALGAGNDVVGGTATSPQAGGDPITIGTSDGVSPTVTNVTVAMIDDELNGTGAAGGTLQVPTNGWNLDLAYSDNSAIATTQTVITANVAVNTSSGSQLAGTNLRPFLTEVSAGNTAATYTVPTTVQFPQTTVTLTVIVSDVSGLSSTPTTFAVAVRPFSAALQPFETAVNASQVWFLDFSRDLESYTTTAEAGGFSVDVVNGANGTSDFEDLLRVIGLTSATPIANVQGGMDSNEVAIDRFKTNLLADLATYYTGANVTFTLTQPAGSFGSSTSVTYSSLGYSAISIGGASTSAGVLGLAIFDPSNTTQNNNTVTDFDSQRLGVFLHTIVDSGMGPPSSSNFRTTFDDFATDLGGTPIGDDAQDGNRLLGTVGDARETAIDAALAELARFVATVTAHECGHSVGLVVNGAMPNGLYGNDSVNFPGSANGHIRNASLFPAGSTNIMSPSLSYTTATSSSTDFNTLNRAYLQEQVFYGN